MRHIEAATCSSTETQSKDCWKESSTEGRCWRECCSDMIGRLHSPEWSQKHRLSKQNLTSIGCSWAGIWYNRWVWKSRKSRLSKGRWCCRMYRRIGMFPMLKCNLVCKWNKWLNLHIWSSWLDKTHNFWVCDCKMSRRSRIWEWNKKEHGLCWDCKKRGAFDQKRWILGSRTLRVSE